MLISGLLDIVSDDNQDDYNEHPAFIKGDFTLTHPDNTQETVHYEAELDEDDYEEVCEFLESIEELANEQENKENEE
jgi:hypothetical protein